MISYIKKIMAEAEQVHEDEVLIQPVLKQIIPQTKWTIDKLFTFEMGHRVWSQQLNNAELSITTDCACKHLHGHSYTIKVFLESTKLDQSSMVTDFKNLNFVKEFLDSTLDHKFMIDINDPNFSLITGMDYNFDNFDNFKNFTNLGDLIVTTNDNLQLHYNSFVLVNFVPTSENICKYLKEYFEDRIKHVATVSAVELWETAKSHCRVESI